ncbi:MAG: VIT1/CCC1 family protein [Synergistaceae bacterium]|jgi:VIT1/CCC1 family predicted Fe2+/Mn2+ transporter|nr:VIT1/CCC1 family protein [Synergistaceae bacterium]
MEKEQGDLTVLFLQFQRSEIERAALYSLLAKSRGDHPHDSEILSRIAGDEALHAKLFEKYTKTRVKPRRSLLRVYELLNKIRGYTFCIKFFERCEVKLNERYGSSPFQIPELLHIMEDKERHENTLIGMLDEDRVRYTGSIVLGMNDALVEQTGSLAGYTLAMGNTRLIAMAASSPACLRPFSWRCPVLYPPGPRDERTCFAHPSTRASPT